GAPDAGYLADDHLVRAGHARAERRLRLLLAGSLDLLADGFRVAVVHVAHLPNPDALAVEPAVREENRPLLGPDRLRRRQSTRDVPAREAVHHLRAQEYVLHPHFGRGVARGQQGHVAGMELLD